MTIVLRLIAGTLSAAATLVVAVGAVLWALARLINSISSND